MYGNIAICLALLTARVISQDILSGTEVEEGTVVTVTLKDEMVGGAQ